MSDNSGGRWLDNPVPIVMMALLAGGIFVNTAVPLESARPVDPDTKPMLSSKQGVEVRLWQDPLAAIAAEPSDKKPERSHHLAEAILKSIKPEDRSKKNQTPIILAVSMPGGSYDAMAEWRRRARFAVVSALNSQGYHPEKPENLGYFKIKVPDPKATGRVPELAVPYEWFKRSFSSSESLPTTRVLVLWLNEEKFASNPYYKYVELFNKITPLGMPLNVKLIGPAQSSVFIELIRNISSEVKTDHNKAAQKQEPAAVLKEGGTLNVFSPTATISDRDLHIALGDSETSVAWNCSMKRNDKDEIKDSENGNSSCPSPVHPLKLPIVRTTLTDDVLSAALLWELWQRGVNRMASWGAGGKCDDGIVLIHELDTPYARSLSKTITEGFIEFCKAKPDPASPEYLAGLPTFMKSFFETVDHALGIIPTAKNAASPDAPVRTFVYMRGLDGVLPGMDSSDRHSPTDKNQEESDKAKKLRKQLEDAPPEHAEGRSQYDYLRRLTLKIEQLDQDRDFAKSGIKAIGVLGTDVYDKLLILMALRNNFKNKIFFTTDLDGRYLHADQKKWTRNLVVASNFDLTLDTALQKSTLPFRDTYQTAVYLSTLIALEREPVNPEDWTNKMEKWLRPMIFEIGRTEAVHLASPSTDDLIKWITHNNPEGIINLEHRPGPNNPSFCSFPDGKLAKCNKIEPQRSQLPPHPEDGLISLIIVLGMMLVALTSRYVQELFHATCLKVQQRLGVFNVPGYMAAAITLVAVFVTLLVTLLLPFELIRGKIRESLELGIGEPLLWLEGVSVWPSLTIRFLGLLLMGLLIFVFLLKLKREADSISKDFGLGQPSTWTLKRGVLPAIVAGPNVDLLMYDKDGNRIHGSDKEDKVKTQIPVIWQNYLRATSCREKCFWIVGSTIIVYCFANLLIALLGFPAFPHRGVLVHDIHIFLVKINVLILWGVIFWASYETRVCARLIDAVSSERATMPDAWAFLPDNSEETNFGVSRSNPNSYLNSYLNFRLIARATQRIQWLIYLPFVSILFLIVARSNFFDAMDFPFSLLVVLGLSLSYALFTQILLRKCAVGARAHAVKYFDEQLVNLRELKDNISGGISETSGCGPELERKGVKPPTLPITEEGITFLRDRIKNTHEGLFAATSQQPALQALLLPFGGYGGMQIIEYLISFTI